MEYTTLNFPDSLSISRFSSWLLSSLWQWCHAGSTVSSASWEIIWEVQWCVQRIENFLRILLTDDKDLGLQNKEGVQVGLLMEEHGGHPVSTGMRRWYIAFSNGCSRSSMSGTIFSKYDQRLDRPCTYAAYAAWGWDGETSSKFMMSFVCPCTLSFMYSSVKVLELSAAPRCRLPWVVMCTPVSVNASQADSLHSYFYR